MKESKKRHFDTPNTTDSVIVYSSKKTSNNDRHGELIPAGSTNTTKNQEPPFSNDIGTIKAQ